MVWSVLNIAGERVGVRDASQQQDTLFCSCGCTKTWTLCRGIITARHLADFAEDLGFAASLDQDRMLVRIRMCVIRDVDRVLEALEKKPDLMRLVYRRLHQIYNDNFHQINDNSPS